MKRSLSYVAVQPPLQRYKKFKKAARTVIRKTRDLRNKQSQRLGLYAVPFPKEKRVLMEWVGTQAAVYPLSTGAHLTVRVNDLYDPETGSYFGTTRKANPFDQLLSANGPYKNYLVEKWEVFTDIINASSYPLNIFQILTLDAAGAGNITLANSYLQDFDRDFQRAMLTPATGSKSTVSLKLGGTLASMVPDPTDVLYTGTYNTSPSSLIYCHTLLDSSMTSNNIQIYMMPRILFYVKLYNYDAPATA